jgi:hypothetical protein
LYILDFGLGILDFRINLLGYQTWFALRRQIRNLTTDFHGFLRINTDYLWKSVEIRADMWSEYRHTYPTFRSVQK